MRSMRCSSFLIRIQRYIYLPWIHARSGFPFVIHDADLCCVVFDVISVLFCKRFVVLRLASGAEKTRR